MARRGLGMLLLGIFMVVAGCKPKKPMIIEVDTDDAAVWTDNSSGSNIIKRVPKGTQFTTPKTKQPDPQFYVITTDNGEGIIYAKDVHVVPPPSTTP